MGQLAHQLGGAIGGVVIHHQDFQVEALLEGQELRQQGLDIAPFVVGRENNRNPGGSRGCPQGGGPRHPAYLMYSLSTPLRLGCRNLRKALASI